MQEVIFYRLLDALEDRSEDIDVRGQLRARLALSRMLKARVGGPLLIDLIPLHGQII